ncbi:MAG: DUF4249 domain-containing protein [Chitinophagales bacterium]|nr:DUF4249 domain-containing protein [Chitinophagales bacterium]MDW8418580.1 DUF4249 family protein [Chitinophagales bacterium]
MKNYIYIFIDKFFSRLRRVIPLFCVVTLITTHSSCTKDIEIEIPDSAKQIVVEGSIERDGPPVILLTKSQKFFDNIDINNLGAYFVRGAYIKIRASDGTTVNLTEYCLQNLPLSEQEKEVLLNALGIPYHDTLPLPDVCIYTVPDIISFFTTGTCSFMGKAKTRYDLEIIAPPLTAGGDSVRVTSYTTIPESTGLDSLGIKQHPNPSYRDSFVAVYAYFSVPDTFGNAIRYWTKRNSEPFYKPESGSVYDDKLFIGLTVGLPIDRGRPSNEEFDINTSPYFRKGDTVTVKWSNIDYNTYQFFYTLENDAGDSPFSSPVKIKSNIQNGLGIWAGYNSKYYTLVIPK